MTTKTPSAKTTEAASSEAPASTETPAASSETAVTSGELQTSFAGPVSDPTSADENAIVIKADGELSGDLFSDAGEVDRIVTVDKDVYEEFYFPGTKRPAYRLLYPAGTQVKKSDLDRLNASRTAVAGAFKIDSTTAVTNPGVDDDGTVKTK